MTLYLTPLTKILLLKKNQEYIYILNKTQYFSMLYQPKHFLINSELGIIVLKKEVNTIYNINSIDKVINNFLFLWDYYLFSKISIKGKSFKLKKKKNYVNFVLNTSHPTWSHSSKHIVKKIKKYKLLYFFTNYKIFNIFINKILGYRFVNIFTKRGLRLNRMRIFKKKGKTNMKI